VNSIAATVRGTKAVRSVPKTADAQITTGLTLDTTVAAASPVPDQGARRFFVGAAPFSASDALLGASRFALRGHARQRA